MSKRSDNPKFIPLLGGGALVVLTWSVRDVTQQLLTRTLPVTPSTSNPTN